MVPSHFLQLAAIGLCVAVLPLSWVWVRGNQAKFRKLLWVSTFLTLDLVMFGSFTRLTDSGLGCPDWPGCYGTASPFIAHAEIRAAETAMPTGPVTMAKAWIEMLHRYFAMALGVLIITQLLLVIFRRRTLRIPIVWPLGLLMLICVQGAFGAWTVTLKLQPAIVTIHLLLGVILLGALGWFAASQTPLPGRPEPQTRPYFAAATLGLVLLFVQIALGGWVSTNYAVLACADFPLCNGQWVPPMDFHQGFHLWRSLGKTSGGEMITADALVAIHWTHRVFAIVTVVYLAWLGLRLRRFDSLRRPASLLLILLIVQFLTGLSNIVLQWPLLNAVAHNGGAALMLLTLVMLDYRILSSRRQAAAMTGA
ncbi:COX15/CtaA family protein [Chitinasiproducens palmae]|uniref:Cytochrome c oxidase assembly protein subunit 15 n=1 Tax=Chitinasiproducens palmae TaxID=1770053 RepID=A0A1H2PPK2_9BURK|nr:COX15/CtaA family protein [Chitinasiproducens palmae]SDV48234.1 cytochrome c oxidase assembly protein subunit 15 [Chitinasiproducens palmae]